MENQLLFLWKGHYSGLGRDGGLIKQEVFFAGSSRTLSGKDVSESGKKVFTDKEVDEKEYEAFITWKKQKRFTNNKFERDSRDNESSGADGKPLQCHVCKSIAHYERNCPNKKTFDNSNDTYFVYEKDTKVFECEVSDVKVGDSLNYLILDTGCPENVSGVDWLNCFYENLSEKQKLSVKRWPSSNKFKFGSGPLFESLFLVEVPVVISGVTVLMKFDVIENSIPLLMGKRTMKEWNLIIDTGNETASLTIDGITKQIDMHTSRNKHWCIEIQPNIPITEIISLFSVKNFSKKEKQLAAERIHRQFCHLSYDSLKKILSVFDPVDVDEEFLALLKNHIDSCSVCKRFKPSIPRPCVGNLLPPEKMVFNEIVTIDLKQRKSRWIMYMIDGVTRYTRACFLNDKKKETIVDSIIKIWLSIFGSANTFLMDNGGEFANDTMRELGNQYGITIKHTAAYAPWANGINERNHYTIDMMMDKMLEDNPNLSEETALLYATSIRNSSMFVNGYTPAQLVLGKNPRLPSISNDMLPALSGNTSSKLISDHLNNLASARKTFSISEISSKLKKALAKPIRSYCDVFFEQGDHVYYKMPDERRWQGPAVVIGQDGKVILIKHGSVCRRVHPCRLLHVEKKSENSLLQDSSVVINDNTCSRKVELESLSPPADIPFEVETGNSSDKIDLNLEAEDQSPSAEERFLVEDQSVIPNSEIPVAVKPKPCLIPKVNDIVEFTDHDGKVA